MRSLVLFNAGLLGLKCVRLERQLTRVKVVLGEPFEVLVCDHSTICVHTLVCPVCLWPSGHTRTLTFTNTHTHTCVKYVKTLYFSWTSLVDHSCHSHLVKSINKGIYLHLTFRCTPKPNLKKKNTILALLAL